MTPLFSKRVPRTLILEELLLVEALPLPDGSLAVCTWLQASYEEDTPVTKLLRVHDGEWQDGPLLPWQAVSMCPWPDGGGVAILGREGHVVRVDAGGVHDLPLAGGDDAPGPFRQLRLCGRTLYALGGARDVYRFDGRRWETLADGFPVFDAEGFDDDEALHAALAEDTDVLFGLAGLSDREVCVAGTDGEVWTLRADAWVREDVPTNVPLFSLGTDAMGRYCAGGGAGTLLVGGPDAWQAIATEERLGNVVSVALAPEAVYLATGQETVAWSHGVARPLVFEDEVMPAHFVLASGDLRLALARKELFVSTDTGTTWQSWL